MNSASLTWISLACGLVLGAMLALLWSGTRKASKRSLPDHWPLSARPVFSATERQLLQRLREALPQHVILAKLPLVRLCQPVDANHLRQWFDLIGNVYVTFAVCTPGGRVVLALDLDHGRPNSRRSETIKVAVLDACRIRHVRTGAEALPSITDIQLMVPDPGGAGVAPHTFQRASATLAHTVRAKRAARGVGGDSSFAQDSFFAMESFGPETTGFGPLPADVPSSAPGELAAKASAAEPPMAPATADPIPAAEPPPVPPTDAPSMAARGAGPDAAAGATGPTQAASASETLGSGIGGRP